MTTTQIKHQPNTRRACPDCTRTVYHYTCDECGADCTAGTRNGPPTSRDGVTRCFPCDNKFTAAEGRLFVAAPAMYALLREVEKFCPVKEQDRIRAIVANVEGAL